jgi:hypothetical protein
MAAPSSCLAAIVFAVAVASSAAAQSVEAVKTAAPEAPSDATADSGLTEDAAQARALDLVPQSKRNWELIGDVQYRQLAVTDQDPANDRRMLYRLQAGYRPLERLDVFLRVGVDQRFVSVDGESGLRFADTAIGASYFHDVPLARLGWDRSLSLFHRFRVFLPTSFESHEQDLYTALEWMTRARVRIVDKLFGGVRGTLLYRFNKYAEQGGPAGATLPRFTAEAALFAEYSPLVSQRYGTVTVGVDLFGDETVHYPGRNPHAIGASELPPGTLASSAVISADGSETFTAPHYGYDIYGVYAPLPNLFFVASLEQAGSVLSNGEPRLYAFNRDQTEFVLRGIVTY